MSLTLLLISLAILTLLSIALGVFFLWLAARIVRIPGVSWRRALATFLVVWLVSLPLSILAYFLDESPLSAVLLLIFWVLCLAVMVCCMKLLLRASFPRAALATVVMLVLNTAATFSLAFCFIIAMAEAFVVPTGAMAPTIYGAHADVICENCDLPYAISMSHREFRRAESTACPNCGQQAIVDANVPALSGDRIIVEKISPPRRWDITVFLYPVDHSTNFVMRLVGMPNETLEIADGDLFIDGKRLQKPPGKVTDMWIALHDTRYVAATPVPGGPRWKPDGSVSNWKRSGGTWTFAAKDGEPDTLSFAHRIDTALAYNMPSFSDAPKPLLGDVKLQCHIGQFSGDGQLTFGWEFRDRRVAATVSTKGKVKLCAWQTSQDDSDDETELGTAEGTIAADLSDGSPLAFAFRDGQAYVMHGGTVAASLLVAPQDVESVERHPNEVCEPCRVGISAEDCSLALSRIVLSRDVYYITFDGMTGNPGSAEGDVPNPIVLQEDQYFMLGDNSARSMDSRFWGTVSGEELIGIARGRYWPPSRWHEFK